MLEKNIKASDKRISDFPEQGVLFRDLMPILAKPKIYKSLVREMAESEICQNAENIIAIDARGFLFGTAIGLLLEKPIVLARKPGKLPGELIEENYQLEYGSNSLSIQKEALLDKNNFVIIDDLLATGGTVNCISKLLNKENKNILGLSVVVELLDLKGRDNLNIPVESIIKY